MKKCPVTGNPTPFVKWLKDGQPIDPAVPLSREDAGIYSIEAEGYSLVKKTLPVLVLCECHIQSSAQTARPPHEEENHFVLSFLTYILHTDSLGSTFHFCHISKIVYCNNVFFYSVYICKLLDAQIKLGSSCCQGARWEWW